MLNFQMIIRKIKSDADFNIMFSEYSDSFMGSFLIETKYKNSITFEIINDRSRIEIDILLSGLFFTERIPLAFFAELLFPNKTDVPKYVYKDGIDVYNCLIQNKYILDTITIMDKCQQKKFFESGKENDLFNKAFRYPNYYRIFQSFRVKDSGLTGRGLTEVSSPCFSLRGLLFEILDQDRIC